MKTLKVIALVSMLLSACVVHREVVVAQGPEQSYQVFYDELAPYGQWVVYSNYGYVWIPNCGPDFMPYGTAGYWVYTDYGWTWYSNYSWGWAPFHYGYWGYDTFYGWYWVPGHVWGPAWVMWRHYPGYYGWAPLGPDFVYGVTVYSTYHPHSWIFLDHHYLGSHDIQSHYGPREQYDTYVNNSTVVGNLYTGPGRGSVNLYTGPSRKEVEKNAGTSITPYKMQQNSKPGQSLEGNQVNMYRPAVSQSISNQPKPVPTRVMDIKDVTPVTQRQMYNQPAPQQPQQRTEQKPQLQPKTEQKQQPQPQPQPKVEPRQQPQPRTQPQPKVEPRQQPQPRTQQPRTEPRQQPRTQPQQRQQPQPRIQPRQQPSPQQKQQPRMQPQQPSKQAPSQSRQGGRKGPLDQSGKAKSKSNNNRDTK